MFVFEKVVHQKIKKNAKRYKFPWKKLALGLDMYKAPRRIRCGNALCRKLWTSIGVLAGCPIAMGALLLAMLPAMDKFTEMESEGLKSLDVYVDDVTTLYEFDKDEKPERIAHFGRIRKENIQF